MLTDDEKTKVLDITKKVFHRLGLENMTMSDVARESQIPEPRLKKEYHDKDTLIKALMSKGIDDVTSILEKSIGSRGKADVKISRFVKSLLSDYEIHAPLFKLVSINHETLDKECLLLRNLLGQEQIDRYRKNTVILGRLIAEGQSEGIFRKADPLECAYYLRGLINSAVRYWQVTRQEGNLEEFADRVMRMFLTGVYK